MIEIYKKVTNLIIKFEKAFKILLLSICWKL